MNTMKCKDCAKKHLAAALSYGKEVISGHSINSELDHRIDFYGELINAEHHIKLFDNEKFIRINEFRKKIEGQNEIPNEVDLNEIRSIFKSFDEIPVNEDLTEDEFVLIYPEVKNKEWFDLSLKCFKENFENGKIHKVIVVNTELELDEEVETYRMTLKDFINTIDFNFIICYENSTAIHKFNKFDLLSTYNEFSSNNYSSLLLTNYAEEKEYHNFDRLKPTYIRTSLLRKAIENYSGNYPLTQMHYFNDQIHGDEDFNVTSYIHKEICCSMPQSLATKQFVRWNEEGFKYIKEYLNK